MRAHRLVLVATAFAACHSSDATSTTPAASDSPAPPPAAAPSGDAPLPPSATTSSPPPPPAPASDAGTDAAPEPAAIRFVGRFDTRDATHPTCAWPGCRIVAKFDGQDVSVTLDEHATSAGPSQWDVSVDGMAMPKLVLQDGTRDYALASGLPSGVHTVELYKRSESQDGVTQFLGFDFGAGELLAPPPRAGRTIEIVGDSQAAGFGVDGVGVVCEAPEWAAKYENFHETFGALLGELLHADVIGTVYSGKGIARDVWRPDTDTMPVLYTRSNPDDASSAQDMSAIASDAILVVLGGNDFDFGQPTDDGPLPVATFEAAYDAFVTTLRADHPDAEIFLVVPATASDIYPAGRNTRTNVTQAIQDILAKRNDPHLSTAAPPEATDAETTGCAGHGNPAFHQRVASQLAAVVGPKLGWK